MCVDEILRVLSRRLAAAFSEQVLRVAYRRLDRILDVMSVPVTGSASAAVVAVDHETPLREVACDVLVAGGGMGGVAAALAMAHLRVCIIEETDWIGGQATSQGVAALDEHEHIEQFGGTRRYYEFREGIRDHYRKLMTSGAAEPVNPGLCWVSQLSFEPRVAVRQMGEMLSVDDARLRLFLRTRIVGVEMEGDRIVSVTAMNFDDGQLTRFRFQYVIDATELGDLLPLTNADYVVGAETVADTGEPDAQPEMHHAHCVQSCTYTFALELRPDSEDHRIPQPANYARNRDDQPYSLQIHVHGGEIYGESTGWLEYGVLHGTPGTKGSLWEYRRLIAAEQFSDRFACDVSMFNWPGIDYRGQPLVEQSAAGLASALQEAKLVSLGFIHWLQTDLGFRNFKLRPDVMGSRDGLSKYPYIREGRRIRSLRTVSQQDVAIGFNTGPRATHFEDSVGVGWYPIDIHQAGEGDMGVSTRTEPFQISLGALIPRKVENLIAGNKNIGTTHITNGCYRLHPVEWNVGEAAGTLAATAVETGVSPAVICSQKVRRRELQRRLISSGMPLAWLVDVPVDSTDFSAVQRLVLSGGYGGRDDTLNFDPGGVIDAAQRAAWLSQISADARDPCVSGPVTRAEFARRLVSTHQI